MSQHPGHPPVAAPPPQPSAPPPGRRAPRLLPLAFVAALCTALPTVLHVLLFGVLDVDLGSGGRLAVVVLATVVCLVGPVLGIAAGVQAVRRCTSAPKVGGALVIAGCALQVLLLIVLCVVGPASGRVMVVLAVLVAGGALPALLNLVGGILGLRTAPPAAG